MNLERYVSSVYCETISDSEFLNKLDEAVKKIEPEETYRALRSSYTEKYIPYSKKEKVSKEKSVKEIKNGEKETKNVEKEIKNVETDTKDETYILDKLFFDILFGKTIGSLYQNKRKSIILFPIFKDVDSKNRLLTSISSIYKPILNKVDLNKPFVRSNENNVLFFVPAFSDSEESVEEYSTDLKSYFSRAFDYILQEKQTTSGGVVQLKENRYETIIYTVDKNNQFFTSYYNKKLTTEKAKALDSIVVKFVEKLGCRLGKVKDPLLSLTKDESVRRFKADGGKTDDLSKLNPYFNLIETFVDIYKKTNDREYLKLTASSDNQSILKIYYRTNNTDNVDVYDEIRPGSNYVYKLYEPDKPNDLRVGYFIEKQGLTHQYIFREYTGLTESFKKIKEGDPDEKQMIEIEKAQEEDTKDIAIPKEFVIETKVIGNRIYYRRITREGNSKFSGKVKQVMNLHIYEKYKWFKFNDLSGELSTETKIKFYKNLLFDKKSLVEFLKKTNRYNEKIPIGVNFLKINQDNKQLVEYVDFLLTTKRDTHVYNSESIFGGNMENFVEKTKKEIVDILFQANKMIYTTNPPAGKTKDDIRNNYKMISYEYYPVVISDKEKEKKKGEDILDKHFEKVIVDDAEIKYCKKGKCQDLYAEIDKPGIEFAISIVDITKENIESIDALKKKTRCKKLRKTIRRQLQPYARKLPHIGGSRSRRRKNRHKS